MRSTFFVVLAVIGVTYGDYWNYISEELDSSEHGVGAGSKGTTCPCGWTNKARVVGGKETAVNEYPLMVAIVDKAKQFVFCGGSIISPRHVLTASHCTEPKRGTPLAVIVGGHNLYQRDERGVTDMIDVEKVVEHEKYDFMSYDNDIAILVLATPIKFNQFVGPACLPNPNAPMSLLNEYIKVLGWGKLANRGRTSKVLMKVDLRVLPLSDCVSKHSLFIDTVHPRQICTFRRNKDSCQGDSGGPLIKLDPETNRFTQVALVSYGQACASMDPAVNTDVTFHMPWIRKVVSETGGDQLCTKL